MISEWRVLLSSTASALGVVAFLAVVASEIERVEHELDRWEKRERREYEKRRMEAAGENQAQVENAA